MRILLVLYFVFLAMASPPSPGVKSHVIDSTVTVSGDTTIVKYIFDRYDFGKIRRASVPKKDNRRRGASPDSSSMVYCHPVDRSRPVGTIEMEEGATPSGARTYSIPIMTAPDAAFAPQISLLYNSQAGDGTAGYGWDIAGVSCISVCNKNNYYHGFVAPAWKDNSDAAYQLDGDPLVTNDITSSAQGYGFVSARGKVLVKRINHSNGSAKYFKALFPDGSSAVYGDSTTVSPSAAYYLRERTDALGNIIRYHYKTRPKAAYVERIDYGFRQGDSSPTARLDFSYATVTGSAASNVSYRAGDEQRKDLLLTSIISSAKGEELRSYTVLYDQSDKTLLKQIDCSVGLDSLNPLRFTYYKENPDYQAYDDFESGTGKYSLREFDPGDDDQFLYKRGRFSKKSSQDGLFIYPVRSTYTIIEVVPYYGVRYGSGYDPDQKIAVFPDIERNAPGFTIVTEEGFQTLDSADTDGDGIDELVKVNLGYSMSNGTVLYMKSYQYDNAVDSVVFTRYRYVKVPGTRQDGVFWNPLPRQYLFGDFRGVGHDEMLVITHPASSGQGATMSLVDVYSGTLVSNSSLPALDDEDSLYHILAADMDADGKTEIYLPLADRLKKYVYDSQQANFTYCCSSSFLLKLRQFRDGRIRIGDFNGDGYQDFVACREEHSFTDSLFLYDGRYFHLKTANLGRRRFGERVHYQDLNKDGFTDMVTEINDSLFFYLNDNGSFPDTPVPSSMWFPGISTIIPGSFRLLHDTSDLITIEDSLVYAYKFHTDKAKEKLITVADRGTGTASANSYGNLAATADSVYSSTSRSYSLSQGYRNILLPLHMLKEGRSFADSSSNVLTSVSYRYYDAAFNTQGLGFCGFGEVDTSDDISGMQTVEVRDPEKMGVPVKVINRLSGSPGTVIDSTILNWSANVTTYRKMNPRLVSSSFTSFLSGVRTEETTQYDSLDFVISRSSTRTLATVQDSSFLKTTFNHWAHHLLQDSAYRLGEIASAISSDSFLYDGRQSTTKESYEYNPAGQPVCIRKWIGSLNGTGTDNDVLLSTDSLSYDARGRLLYKGSAPRGSTRFIGQEYAYVSSSNLLDSSHDEYGRLTEYMSYDKYGNPHRVWNEGESWQADFTYDAWGRQTGVLHHDGTRDTTSIGWSNVGLYKVWTKKAGQPETVVHYDAAGREVRRSDRRFDGSWRHVDTEYNSKGQVARVSLPHRDTSSVIQWTDYHYDVYGRVDTVYAANGRKDVTVYNGRKTTTTQNGVSRTTTVNARGEVIRSSDAAGSVTFSLRPDGQIESSTAPGNATTTFGYDFTGRRTQMVSPGAGTHTYAYSINTATGAQTTVHTSPEGTVTTTADKYGRMVSRINGSDFSTAWTYSNRLLQSEVSTNGTRKDYTYDGHERLSSVKETSLDGKWLKQLFSYSNDDDGNLTETLLICNTDTLGTERYYYQNGYKVVTSFLPHNAQSPVDTILVWKLTAENDLGLLTAGQSAGGLTRTYEYDAYGRQTRRTLGTVMDFGYTYDLNDNLASRSDNTRNLSESFTYDSLDRLTGAGDTYWTYASNGNIAYDSGLGTYVYGDSGNPYRQTGLVSPAQGIYRNFDLTFNSFSRPEVVCNVLWDDCTAGFDYYGDYALAYSRVDYDYLDSGEYVRYYFDGRYEFESSEDSLFEDELYLGGDAFTAPVVIRRFWTIDDPGGPADADVTVFNIGRDNVGSITHLVSLYGELMWEDSYDPWGRPRDVDSWEVDYLPAQDPVLRRCYAGYTYIPDLHFYHAGARLYNPQTGRFLGYDPYVQDTENSQNWNSFSYCLNNPFRYTDPSGESLIWLIGATIGGISNWLANGAQWNWKGLGYFGIGFGIGALGFFTSAWTAGITQACGVWAGALVGSATGALSGGVTGGVTQGLNNLVAGEKFGKDFWKAFGQGALSGAISGAISGGIRGYQLAKEHSVNPWNNKGYMDFEQEWKSDVPLQKDPKAFCYADVAAYADEGHGSHPSEFFSMIAEEREGWDVGTVMSQAFSTDELRVVRYIKAPPISQLEGFLSQSCNEAAAMLNNEPHWVNVLGIRNYGRMTSFGNHFIVSSSDFIIRDPIVGVKSFVSELRHFRFFTYIIDIL